MSKWCPFRQFQTGNADHCEEHQNGADERFRRQMPGKHEEFQQVRRRNFNGSDDGANGGVLVTQSQRHRVERSDGGDADVKNAENAVPSERERRCGETEEENDGEDETWGDDGKFFFKMKSVCSNCS